MGTALYSGSDTATAFPRHLWVPESFPLEIRFGRAHPRRDYNRPGPVSSHLDPRTRAWVPPPHKDPIGGANTLEGARERYRAKLAALLRAGRHEMPSVIGDRRVQR